MSVPWQEPTERRPERLADETIDLGSLTEAEDPAAPRLPEGELTDREDQPGTRHGIAADATPLRIGRYRVERRLGSGGFGDVYLAYDEQLDRRIAVKVPHARLVATSTDARLYLDEARAVAQLDHPNIVPVFDVGGSDRFPCYVVSKYVDSETLAHRIQRDRPGWTESAELIATIAEALDHAHSKGLVHRDVKPGNILIDRDGVPFVVDFGLALRDVDHGTGPRYVGTPAYMSPEQAWGEGHRLDRRSDIFSLGIVFYELLCGVRPFLGPTRELLMIQMTSEEPRPPCQVDASIPGELQRICLKALAKRATDRYPSAQAMASDLRLFLAECAGTAPALNRADRRARIGPPASADTGYFLSGPRKVIPKGLRSFSERDAEFFIELLPGPRDRDGLPMGLRYWKEWVERSEPDPASTVGLIYGPSGCGKTSLVKAGLIPVLDKRILPVYVEATAAETESRLLAGLRRRCPALPQELNLKESLATLRRGGHLPSDSKVLLILDQFEQWLHARRGEESPSLLHDLRQCDGEHVQCLVMVRDDFWMAATRFMKALEVPLLEGQNSASVDLFDLSHARRVLAAFGRAYGKLDANPARGRDRDQFLDEAVEGLAQEGKVVCVRLALFAEMMKSREWTRATLGQVGGARGVGFTFLEENFGVATAPPAHLRHQAAARAVLAALLPESGTDIKGHMRSEVELLDASGYSGHPAEFEELIRILDPELRLITPTDPEGAMGDSVATPQAAASGISGQRYYQLTHDYLVHSVSDWLTRKQRESRRGRAELCLQERALLWSGKPEPRFLPSVGEWLNIRLLTRPGGWTEPQRVMMRRAGWRYGLLGGLLAGVVALVVWGSSEARTYFWVQGKVGSLGTAKTSEVPSIITQLDGTRRWADPQLRSLIQNSGQDSLVHLHASLALLPSDPSQVDYLFDQLLSSEPEEFPAIRDGLAPHRQRVGPRLWRELEAAQSGDRSILPAAAALAMYAPRDARWKVQSEKVAHQLATATPASLGIWLGALRPVRDILTPPVVEIFRDSSGAGNQRFIAAIVLADYAADRPDLLAELLASADSGDFDTLFAVARKQPAKMLPALRAEFARQALVPPTEPSDGDAYQTDRDRLASRQAHAAAALVRMDQLDEVIPHLAYSEDPRLRSSLIYWLPPLGLGADPRALAAKLSPVEQPAKILDRSPSIKEVLFDRETSIQRAILSMLGQYDPERLDPELGQSMRARVLALFKDDPDAGVHGAAGWVLRQWRQDAALRDAEAELSRNKLLPGRRWYVNSQGMTLSLIEGPVEFAMGSSPSDPDHMSPEVPHISVIPRRFAMGTTEVTFAQFQAFLKDTGKEMRETMARPRRHPDDPVGTPSWYDAAEFCNWLSRKEGLRPCYEPDPRGGYVVGMKIPADVLQRDGYRLPTEAEWEYACRAGATTGRYYGSDPALLDRYAWYNMNSDGLSHPCGRLLPNDLGLFDMFGNLFEWCQDRLKNSDTVPGSRIIDEVREETALSEDLRFILRSGSYGDLAREQNAAHRIWNAPRNQLEGYGFRIARTMSAR